MAQELPKHRGFFESSPLERARVYKNLPMVVGLTGHCPAFSHRDAGRGREIFFVYGVKDQPKKQISPLFDFKSICVVFVRILHVAVLYPRTPVSMATATDQYYVSSLAKSRP